MKKIEEKKTSVNNTDKKVTAKKPATKSTATKKSTAAKTTVKTAATKPATTPKKTTRKPKPVTIDTICGLIFKKLNQTKAAKITGTIAADIEVWGFEDGSNQKMYIEIKDGKLSVMPHSYDAKDFRVSLSFANAIDFANGKITLDKLIMSKDFYAEGNIVSAIKLASIF